MVKLKQKDVESSTSRMEKRKVERMKRVHLIKFRWAGGHIGQKPFKNTPMW